MNPTMGYYAHQPPANQPYYSGQPATSPPPQQGMGYLHDWRQPPAILTPTPPPQAPSPRILLPQSAPQYLMPTYAYQTLVAATSAVCSKVDLFFFFFVTFPHDHVV